MTAKTKMTCDNCGHKAVCKFYNGLRNIADTMTPVNGSVYYTRKLLDKLETVGAECRDHTDALNLVSVATTKE